jgi:hypothetical protein
MTPWRCCERTPERVFCRLLQKDAEGQPRVRTHPRGADHPTFESINHDELKEYFDGAWASRPADWSRAGCKFEP